MVLQVQGLFIVFNIYILLMVESCPPSCRCLETINTSVVDCSSIGLTEFPIVSPNVTRLLISGNQLESVEKLETLSLSRLEYLDLSNNPIGNIASSSFTGVPFLKNLAITADAIDDSTLDGLELESFTLIGGSMETVSAKLLNPSRDSLKSITIKDTKIAELNFLTFGFPNLETLNVNGNHLTTFEFYGGITNLRNVNLSSNMLQHIKCNHPLHNATHFDVSFNELHYLPQDFPRCFPQLIDVKLQHNALSTLPTGFFVDLKTSLESIDLSHNPWISLPTDELGLMLNLKELRLQNMSAIDLDLSPIERSGIKSLSILDLSYNSKLKSYKIPRKTKIDRLIFTDSSLQTFPIMAQQHGIISRIDVQRNDIQELIIGQSIKHLNASHNRIRFINISFAWAEIDLLDVGHNKIESTDDIHIGSNTYLNYFNLTFNKLKTINSFYQVPPDIRGKYGYKIHPIRMDFSYNSLTSVNRSAFLRVQPMVSLKLNGNKLTSLPDDLLVQQRRLNKLDLNHNRLKRIPTNLSRTVKYLSHLLLADNQIRRIYTIELKGLFNLLSLDLSSNSYLSEIPSDFLSRNKRLRRFSIFNTSIGCTCNLTATFLNIIKANKRLKYDGNCLDKSTGYSQKLRTIVESSETNPWLCNDDCSVLKCVLGEQCFQRVNTSLEFNCSCEHSSNNNSSSSNATFSFPIYGNPPWVAPSREASSSRDLIFCQTHSCDSPSNSNATTNRPTSSRHPKGKCIWSSIGQSDLQTGVLIECSKFPLLTKMFCKPEIKTHFTTASPLPPKNDSKTNFTKTAKIIVGLSSVVGALFFVGIVAFFGHRWKAHRSVDAQADMYVLTDFDYLNDVTIEG